MSITKEYVLRLLKANQKEWSTAKEDLLDSFSNEKEVVETIALIKNYQEKLMENWQIKESIYDIIHNQVQIPNGTVDKSYTYKFDFEKLNWDKIVYSEIIGLDEIGLVYDKDEEVLSGTPILSGDFKIKLIFRVKGETENSALNEKIINLIINANPKSLWKNLPSDKEDTYWKEDEVAISDCLSSKSIVVASKRGRSHANIGSFRDDDFAYKSFNNTGWNVVAVADGAGSAKYSRKGSAIACQEVVNYFETLFTDDKVNELEELISEHNQVSKEDIVSSQSQLVDSGTDTLTKKTSSQIAISRYIYSLLGGCARQVHNKLEEFALANDFESKDLHTTLIFSLFKKFDFGYAILSFGVGDCPIGMMNVEMNQVTLMNWLDVGEFGGGTRFITMPEIFSNDKFHTRFGFKLVEDFSYLVLMTDGIYDAKFVVEANLEKVEAWNAFFKDLQGENEDGTAVVFEKNNIDMANQLSKWMDFWSPGNHDDRTLAIVF